MVGRPCQQPGSTSHFWGGFGQRLLSARPANDIQKIEHQMIIYPVVYILCHIPRKFIKKSIVELNPFSILIA